MDVPETTRHLIYHQEPILRQQNPAVAHIGYNSTLTIKLTY